MANSGLKLLLDRVDWQPCEPPINSQGLPWVTHSGVLRVGDCELRVRQLNTGERIILESDMAAFFGVTLDELGEMMKFVNKDRIEAARTEFIDRG